MARTARALPTTAPRSTSTRVRRIIVDACISVTLLQPRLDPEREPPLPVIEREAAAEQARRRHREVRRIEREIDAALDRDAQPDEHAAVVEPGGVLVDPDQLEQERA